jgi:AraC-like DNA-binding protein
MLCFWQRPVDLWGQLSNPPETLETVTGQGIERAPEAHEEPSKQAICSPTASKSDVQEVPGRLSNPSVPTSPPPSPRPHRQVQRRLRTSDVDDICESYVSGKSIDDLARSYGVNRTTIISHLDQHGVPRRRVVRKMTDAQVAEAAAMYRDDHSLATVATEFKVDARTLGREFRKAGVSIRPRRGWTY